MKFIDSDKVMSLFFSKEQIGKDENMRSQNTAKEVSLNNRNFNGCGETGSGGPPPQKRTILNIK